MAHGLEGHMSREAMDRISAERAPDRLLWKKIYRILFGDAELVPEQGENYYDHALPAPCLINIVSFSRF